MIVISGVRDSRPEPVIGFVLGEICCRRQREPQEHENRDGGKADPHRRSLLRRRPSQSRERAMPKPSSTKATCEFP